MKVLKYAVVPTVVGMFAMGSVAFGADDPKGPVMLSDQQMDSVVAGQVTQEGLVNVGLHLEEKAVFVPIDIEVRQVQVAVAALSKGLIIQHAP
jgi:hypothetical protein